ncbi:MAG: hypothetical protein E6Q43_01170 [Dokdonella sp.]|nr:MAG: hypothetical protein E6Q43_01170 [Dokdonella sp.]
MNALVAIRDVADVVRGVSFDRNEVLDENRDGYLPILRAGNIEGELLLDRDLVWVPQSRVGAEQRMRPGDIAICMSSGSQAVVGKTAPLRRPWDGSVGAFCAIVRPKTEKTVPEYLSFFMQSEGFRAWTRQSSGANIKIKNIRKTELESFALQLPSLDKQRPIVDLLSRAEGIVRLRREAQAKAAEIIPALFLDMFGDPATNPKEWMEAQLGDLVEEFRYGTSQKSGTSGLAALRIPNVIGNRLDPSEMKLVDVMESEANRLRLRTGDLLFVRTNGNPDYVGRSAVFEPEIMSAAGCDGSNCIYASYLIRARLKANSVRPGFLQSFLSSQEGRKRLREQARTSAGQYNINTEGLSSIRVPRPPFDAQVRFEERSRSVLGIVAQQSEALNKAEAAFQTLLACAFSGNLATAAALKEAAVA